MDPISCPENGPIFGSEEPAFPDLILLKKGSRRKQKMPARKKQVNSPKKTIPRRVVSGDLKKKKK